MRSSPPTRMSPLNKLSWLFAFAGPPPGIVTSSSAMSIEKQVDFLLKKARTKSTTPTGGAASSSGGECGDKTTSGSSLVYADDAEEFEMEVEASASSSSSLLSGTTKHQTARTHEYLLRESVPIGGDLEFGVKNIFALMQSIQKIYTETTAGCEDMRLERLLKLRLKVKDRGFNLHSKVLNLRQLVREHYTFNSKSNPLTTSLSEEAESDNTVLDSLISTFTLKDWSDLLFVYQSRFFFSYFRVLFFSALTSKFYKDFFPVSDSKGLQKLGFLFQKAAVELPKYLTGRQRDTSAEQQTHAEQQHDREESSALDEIQYPKQISYLIRGCRSYQGSKNAFKILALAPNQGREVLTDAKFQNQRCLKYRNDVLRQLLAAKVDFVDYTAESRTTGIYIVEGEQDHQLSNMRDAEQKQTPPPAPSVQHKQNFNHLAYEEMDPTSLQTGNVITHLDGIKLESVAHFHQILRQSLGEEVEVVASSTSSASQEQELPSNPNSASNDILISVDRDERDKIHPLPKKISEVAGSRCYEMVFKGGNNVKLIQVAMLKLLGDENLEKLMPASTSRRQNLDDVGEDNHPGSSVAATTTTFQSSVKKKPTIYSLVDPKPSNLKESVNQLKQKYLPTDWSDLDFSVNIDRVRPECAVFRSDTIHRIVMEKISEKLFHGLIELLTMDEEMLAFGQEVKHWILEREKDLGTFLNEMVLEEKEKVEKILDFVVKKEKMRENFFFEKDPVVARAVARRAGTRWEEDASSSEDTAEEDEDDEDLSRVVLQPSPTEQDVDNNLSSASSTSSAGIGNATLWSPNSKIEAAGDDVDELSLNSTSARQNRKADVGSKTRGRSRSASRKKKKKGLVIKPSSSAKQIASSRSRSKTSSKTRTYSSGALHTHHQGGSDWFENHANLLRELLRKFKITGVVPSESRPFIVQLPEAVSVEGKFFDEKTSGVVGVADIAPTPTSSTSASSCATGGRAATPAPPVLGKGKGGGATLIENKTTLDHPATSFCSGGKGSGKGSSSAVLRKGKGPSTCAAASSYQNFVMAAQQKEWQEIQEVVQSVTPPAPAASSSSSCQSRIRSSSLGKKGKGGSFQYDNSKTNTGKGKLLATLLAASNTSGAGRNKGKNCNMVDGAAGSSADPILNAHGRSYSGGVCSGGPPGAPQRFLDHNHTTGNDEDSELCSDEEQEEIPNLLQPTTRLLSSTPDHLQDSHSDPDNLVLDLSCEDKAAHQVDHEPEQPKMKVITSTRFQPSFLRARMIRGIGYADSRVLDEKGLLWFDLLRGMIDVRIKAPLLEKIDPFYERFLAKGIEIYDFSHHTSVDFDAQTFEPAYRLAEMTLRLPKFDVVDTDTSSCGKVKAPLSQSRRPEDDDDSSAEDDQRGQCDDALQTSRSPSSSRSVSLTNSSRSYSPSQSASPALLMRRAEQHSRVGERSSIKGSTTLSRTRRTSRRKLRRRGTSRGSSSSKRGHHHQADLFEGDTRVDVEQLPLVIATSPGQGSRSFAVVQQCDEHDCDSPSHHQTETVTGLVNSLEAQIEDSILCAFGSPHLQVREDERVWKTPKIEKRFQRWALLVGAAVFTTSAVGNGKTGGTGTSGAGGGATTTAITHYAGSPSSTTSTPLEITWEKAKQLFGYLQFGLLFFFDDLPAFLTRVDQNHRGRRGGTGTGDRATGASNKQSIVFQAKDYIENVVKVKAARRVNGNKKELDEILRKLDPHALTSHANVFTFLQPVAASTLKAHRSGRLYRQALNRYHHVIDPAVGVLKNWAEVCDYMAEKGIAKSAFQRKQLYDVEFDLVKVIGGRAG
ncbi:unnamed protein product [Amoebophrya sp. A120]|nr:unnamed protein product [Amoebophrya sp. A120]|eukprot:GSA120T00006744001.1